MEAQIPPPHAASLESSLAWIAQNAKRGEVLRWPGIGLKSWQRIGRLLEGRELTFADGPLVPPPPPPISVEQRLAEERAQARDLEAWRRRLIGKRRKLDEINAANADVEASIERYQRAATGAAIECLRCGVLVSLPGLYERHFGGASQDRPPQEAAAALYGLAAGAIGLGNGHCPDCNPLVPRQTCERCGARLPAATIDELTAAITALRASGGTPEERHRVAEDWLGEAVSGQCDACRDIEAR